jgi:hypothetical protein
MQFNLNNGRLQGPGILHQYIGIPVVKRRFDYYEITLVSQYILYVFLDCGVHF